MEGISFKEIKSSIKSITTELNNYVDINEIDYTHIPSDFDIISKISDCITELNNLMNKI